VANFLLKIQKEFGIILIIGGGPPNGARGEPHAKEQQFHESDSFGHKKVQNDKIPGKRGVKHI